MTGTIDNRLVWCTNSRQVVKMPRTIDLYSNTPPPPPCTAHVVHQLKTSSQDKWSNRLIRQYPPVLPLWCTNSRQVVKMTGAIDLYSNTPPPCTALVGHQLKIIIMKKTPPPLYCPCGAPTQDNNHKKETYDVGANKLLL